MLGALFCRSDRGRFFNSGHLGESYDGIRHYDELMIAYIIVINLLK